MARLEIVRGIVVKHFGITEEQFCGRGRHPTVVRAREAFVLVAYRQARASWPQVAQAMKPRGARSNHSTALTAARRAEANLQTDAVFRDQVEALESMVKSVLPRDAHTPPIERATPLAAPSYRLEGEGEAGLCPWCGRQAARVEVHGHGQCAACGMNVAPWCEGLEVNNG